MMSKPIKFVIQADPMHSWKSWGHSQYPSIADVIAELGDNSIQAKTGINGVHFDITVDENKQRWLTVEDGGQWPTITIDVARLCFGYGTIEGRKEGLNEHNCGLKNSLAYLDRTNNRWFIQIRQGKDVWQLKAPYNMNMELTNGNKYIGKLDIQNSTFIRVPIDDTQFKTLYERSVNSKPNDELLLDRLRLYLETTWMMRKDIIDKKVPIFFNGKQILPYSFLAEDGTEVYKHDANKVTLGDSIVTLEVQRILLHPNYRKDHPIFKRSLEHAGVFIFKNGRLINKTPLFKEIYGKVRDGHYSGKIAIVNVTGESSDSLETTTTKNEFSSHDPKLEQLYAAIRECCKLDNVKTPQSIDVPIVERELVRRLAELMMKTNEKRIAKGIYEIRQERVQALHSNGISLVTKEKPDMLEIDKSEKTIRIWEAKRVSLSVDNLRQLFFYYRNIKNHCPEFSDYDIECILIIASSTEPTQQYDDELLMLQTVMPGFNPTIRRFSEFGIHPS
jgi:hypothetical protein